MSETMPFPPSVPLVSVVIPAYNAARFLPETVASAQAQTYPTLEIIIVDDGSTDETAEIVTRLAASDRRVRLIRQANAGSAAARNRAIEVARGEFIAPLDADDLWHPRMVELLVGALQAASVETAVAYCWSYLIRENGEIFGTQRPPKFEDRRSLFLASVPGQIIGNGSASVVRASAVRAVGGYSSHTRQFGVQVGATRLFYLELARRYDFVCVPQLLVGYRRHRASVTMQRAGRARSQLLLMEEIRRRFPNLPKYVVTQLKVKAYGVEIAYLATDVSVAKAICRTLQVMFHEPDAAWKLIRHLHAKAYHKFRPRFTETTLTLHGKSFHDFVIEDGETRARV